MSEKWRTEMKARVRSGDPEAIALVPHGTLTGYNGYGCKCAPCSRSMSDYCKDRRRRLGLTKDRMPTPDQRAVAVEAIRRRGPTATATETGYSKATLILWAKSSDPEARERIGLLIETDQVRNAMEGKHCPVDGVPLPDYRAKTCSHRCAQLWTATRYQVDEDQRSAHMERVALWNIEHSDDPVALRHARKIMRGEPLNEHGRWLNSKEQVARLEEVMERRAQAKAKWGDLGADLPPIRALEKKSA